MRPIIPVTAGLLTHAVLQSAWRLSRPEATGDAARVFSGAFGLVGCCAVYAIVAAIVVAYRHQATDLLRRTGLLWIGVVAAMVGAELIIGPGKLWVLRIAFVSAAVGGAMLVGAVLGAVVGSVHLDR